MGLLCLPAMLKAGYDPKLACGAICASGTLGQIIPPSIVLVLLDDVLQGANTQAHLAKGNFDPDPVSVVDLFAGAFLPGLVLVALYMGWVAFQAVVRPESSPSLLEGGGAVEDLGMRIAKAVAPPAILIVMVLGSILGGVATPTESAAVGAVGAMALAAARAYRNGRWYKYPPGLSFQPAPALGAAPFQGTESRLVGHLAAFSDPIAQIDVFQALATRPV